MTTRPARSAGAERARRQAAGIRETVDRTSALRPIFVCFRPETPRTRLDVGGIAVELDAFSQKQVQIAKFDPF